MSNSNDKIDLKEFIQLKQIGKGSFGIVYLIKKIETGKLYAAKVLNLQINSISKEEIISLSHEVNISAGINHPACLKFIGYSPTNFNNEQYPVIITEYCKNGSLLSLIKNYGQNSEIWNDTKKLITIYGIASGMKYIHSKAILHRDLKTENILMDDILCPKIADFGLSKKIHFNQNSMSLKSAQNVKGTPAFIAPEVFETKICTISNDIYAFGFILHEIITGIIPSDENVTFLRFLVNVREGKRPLFDEKFPKPYGSLIEKCLSLNAAERPTFDQIVKQLKNDEEFITEKVNKEDYYGYVKFIDEYKDSFDSRKIIKIEDYINLASQTFQEIDLRKYSEQPPNTFLMSFRNFFGKSQKKLFPVDMYDELDENCKRLVVDAEDNSEKQFFIGTFLIEGKNNFPLNIDIGIKYFERSIEGGYIESVVYLSSILIKGVIINQDLKKAKKYLSSYLRVNDNRISYLYGKILKKENKIKEARKWFQKGAENGDPQSIHSYAKMLFTGDGGNADFERARHFFSLSYDQGFIRSNIYLILLDEICNNRSFQLLPYEFQLFFTNQIVKNKGFKEIEIRILTFSKIRGENMINFIIVIQMFESIKFEMQNKHLHTLFYEIRSFGPSLISKINICISDKIITQQYNQMYNLFNSVTIKSTVCEICHYSFSNCKLLKNISFEVPSSLASIGDHAFEYCTSLTQITIPSSVPSIGDYTFYKCLSLKQITIPSSVTSIGEFAFEGCDSLTELIFEIPSSALSIGFNAFNACKSLKKITIPSSIISFENSSFRFCKSLTEIIFEIPSSIKRFGKESFYNCSLLTQITIPSSVTSIGENAFDNCSLLSEIKFEIPSSLTSIGDCAFKECRSLTQITIPSSVTSIGNDAFTRCTSLTKILFEIPSSLTSIGDCAFSKCTSLTQITIPSSVTSIGNESFTRCTSLTKILFEIPSSLASIGNCAFIECKSLTQITIPSSVTSAGYHLFFGCLSLKKENIGNLKILKH